jgi:hypothetical protein
MNKDEFNPITVLRPLSHLTLESGPLVRFHHAKGPTISPRRPDLSLVEGFLRELKRRGIAPKYVLQALEKYVYALRQERRT